MLKRNFFPVKSAEYLFIIPVMFYWYSSSVSLNPVAMGIILGLIFQVIFKIRITGMIISGFFIAASLYMLLALLSELNEFPTFDAGARKLFFTGFPFLLWILFVAGLMLYRYLIPKSEEGRPSC